MKRFYSLKAVFAVLFVSCLAFGSTMKAADDKILVEVGDKSGWSVKAFSSDQNNSSSTEGPASNAIDGRTSNFWHTQWGPSLVDFPHWIIVDMGKEYDVAAFTYASRDNDRGRVKDFELYFSNEDWSAVNWSDNSAVQSLTWASTAGGSFIDDQEQKQLFGTYELDAPIKARYFKFKATSGSISKHDATAQKYICVAELGIKVEVDAPIVAGKKYYIRNGYTGMYLNKDASLSNHGDLALGSLEFGNADFEFSFVPESPQDNKYKMVVGGQNVILQDGWRVVLKENETSGTEVVVLKDLAVLTNAVSFYIAFDGKTQFFGPDLDSDNVFVYGNMASTKNARLWYLEEIPAARPPVPSLDESYMIKSRATGYFLTYPETAPAGDTKLGVSSTELTGNDLNRQIFRFTKEGDFFYIKETLTNKYLQQTGSTWASSFVDNITEDNKSSCLFVVSPNVNGAKIRAARHKNGNLKLHLGFQTDGKCYFDKDAVSSATDWEFVLVEDFTTGIDYSESAKAAVVLNDGVLSISSPNSVQDVAIYNLQGALVFKAQNIDQQEVKIAGVDLSGVLIVKLVTSNGVETVKLIAD